MIEKCQKQGKIASFILSAQYYIRNYYVVFAKHIVRNNILGITIYKIILLFDRNHKVIVIRN